MTVYVSSANQKIQVHLALYTFHQQTRKLRQFKKNFVGFTAHYVDVYPSEKWTGSFLRYANVHLGKEMGILTAIKSQL